MSIAFGVPVLECVYFIACARWAWKRCIHSGSQDSERWSLAESPEFEPVPRMCRLVLAVYEEDLRSPKWAPPGGYRIDIDCVAKKADYKYTHGRAPPYLIYVDHHAQDIVVAIRGLNLGRESDYAVLLDNRLGQELFDGGYVHHGLLESANWLLKKESEILRKLIINNPMYTLTFAGHSLGSGVAAMLTMLAVKYREKLGNIARDKVRCYAIAPARCMSLNLAVRYADIINSVVLQDDFLPRTATPLEDIFKCICWCGRYPPEVRTAVPVEGRFEHIVLSCNATTDHSLLWIEKESQKALELMVEKENAMDIPMPQRMVRQNTLREEHLEEHKAALERAVTLNVPHTSTYGTFESNQIDWEDKVDDDGSEQSDSGENSGIQRPPSNAKSNWNFLIKNFVKDESGKYIWKRRQDIV